MGCLDGITKDIASTCENQPIPGVEVKAWVGNRLEATITYDVTNPSKITDISMASTKKLYTLTGVKKLLNPGSSLIVAPDRADRYQHKFNFQGFEFTCDDVENIDALNDLFVVVEMIDKATGGDGTFRGFGIQNGLYKTSLEWTANDIDGAIAIEMANEEGANEPYPWWTVLDTDYATTLAMLVAQESAQP
jgi:hypothetical protein